MKTTPPCPSEKRLFRRMENSPDATVLSHMQSCAACRKAWQDNERLSSLAKALPASSPEPHRMAEIRRNLLTEEREDAPSLIEKRRHRRYAAVAAAMLAIGVGAALIGHPPFSSDMESRDIFRGRVHPHDNARFMIVQPQPDEIVRLTRGTITVRVSPLKTNEHFRVIVGDSQVIVKGTVFDVTAVDDRLERVRVISGTVIVRFGERGEEILTAGREWRRPRSPSATGTVSTSSLSPKETTAQPPFPSPRPEHGAKTDRRAKRHALLLEKRKRRGLPGNDKHRVSKEETVPKETAEAAFRRGWNQLRRDAFEAAATDFETALSLPGSAAVAEDAAYWLGVAYSRGNVHEKAVPALDRFVTQYPHSPRISEAVLIMGWSYVETGDVEKAKHCFEQARHASSPKIRKSAEQGLFAIRRGVR